MNYTLEDIADIVSGKLFQSKNNLFSINRVVIDSRVNYINRHSIFVALPGAMYDGHNFLDEFSKKGGKAAIISDKKFMAEIRQLHYILVDNTLEALQNLAVHHRQKFPNLKVISIAGSNGKTIVKEWLVSLIPEYISVVKTIGSYNSQIGVALSVLQIQEHHDIGIFEAGISTIGEMEKLEGMIQPHFGIFTNLGSAHDAGFRNREEKFIEKIALFKNCSWVITSSENRPWFEKYAANHNFELLSWDVSKKSVNNTKHSISINNRPSFTADIPFRDPASTQNLINVLACLHQLEIPINGLNSLPSLNMRLEIRQGIDGSLIVNDTYINDRESLEAALEFMEIHAEGRNKILVVSDFVQSNFSPSKTIIVLLDMLEKYKLKLLVLYGATLCKYFKISQNNIKKCKNEEELNRLLKNLNLKDSIILFKTSRKYTLDNFVKKLYAQKNSAILMINLSALDQNISAIHSLLDPKCRLMAVIKSAAYGGGISGITSVLTRRNIAYLAVANIDEGIELRKRGISKPILIFNPDYSELDEMVNWNLEPEVFSFESLVQLQNYNKQDILPIHLKIDTGMHRLGIPCEEIDELKKALSHLRNLKIASVFSHLSAADSPVSDEHTLSQIQRFERAYQTICDGLTYRPIRHILNTDGLLRFPEYQFEMVRVGIGLYGISQSLSHTAQKNTLTLKKVHSLKAKIIQIKSAPKGAVVSYGSQCRLVRDSKLAVVNIGYADGIPRSLSDGKYGFWINGQYAPIVGKICMDTTIIDITDAKNVHTGDEAIIFNDEYPIEKMASAANTIPYEILCRISPRISKQYIGY